MQASPDYKIVVIEGAAVHPRLIHALQSHQCWSERVQYPRTDTMSGFTDTESQTVIATAAIMIERKFIRNCAKVRTFLL